MEEQKFAAPSFPRLMALNLPEWTQASFGCLGAILFGGFNLYMHLLWGQ